MSTINIRDVYARRLIQESWRSYYEGLPLPTVPTNDFVREPESMEDIARMLDRYSETFGHLRIGPEIVLPSRPNEIPLPIGIIGAGVTGLYAAMILESLDLEYEILEASDRIGGKLRTHHLGDGKNEYYDVGATHFPKIPAMDRAFDLFRRVGISSEDETMIRHQLSTESDKCLYNNVSASASKLNSSGDLFGFGEACGGTVPQEYIAQGHKHWVDLKVDFLRYVLKHDYKLEGKGWKALKQVDPYSMRSFMLVSMVDPSGRRYPNPVVNWCEKLDSGSRTYDNAVSELVLDSLDYDPSDVKWYAVQGGAEEIAIAMAKTLQSEVIKNKRVTAIYPTDEVYLPGPDSHRIHSTISAEVEGEQGHRSYDHVISTIPLGMLRFVDTRKCGFSSALNEAIRTVKYDGCVKVAIKFKERWWEQPPYNQKGGQSRTDRPTNVIVYPSHGIGGENGVLTAECSTVQDDLRFSGCRQGSKPQVVIDTILRDICDIHGIPSSELTEMVESHDVYDWTQDENSGGARVVFGPGQFRDLYPEVTKPAAGGRLHFAGEATSAHHRWIVGALNSAYRSVKEILVFRGDHVRLKMLRDQWGEVHEAKLDTMARQVSIGIHESTILAKDNASDNDSDSLYSDRM